MLFRSDPVALLLAPDGGVREVARPPGRVVLDDALVRRLARLGSAVQAVLGPGPQDIEWAVDGDGRIALLQSRPLASATAALSARQAPSP